MNQPYLSPSEDQRPTHELVRVALTEQDEHLAWRAISALHFRGTREVFEAASTLTRSEVAEERAVGAHILGQLGIPDRSYPEEQFQCLIALLKPEEAPEALSAACTALGHLDDPRAMPLVIPFKDHPNDDVRFAVAFALSFWEAEESIHALIALSQDESANVRDWATFALGAQFNADTPEIRAALFDRLQGEHEDVEFEALAGLAKRRDERILDKLVDDMAEGRFTDYSELCQGLMAMQQRYRGDSEKLRTALSSCVEDDE